MEKQYKTNRPGFTVSRNGKTYRADKNCVIIADTEEIAKVFEAYKFKRIEGVETPAVQNVEPKKEEPIDNTVDGNVIVEVPNKKK